MEEDVEYIKNHGSGKLKIGITEEFRAVMPELFEIFLEKNPKYDIKLVEGNTGNVINKLRSHEIHFCLSPLRYLDEDMQSVFLSHNRYALLVRREEVEKYKKNQSLTVFNDFNFISVENTYDFKAFIKSNHISYQNLLQVNTIGAAVRLVKKGLGISVIPELYARNYTDPEVKSVQLKYELHGPDLYLSYMKRQNLPPAIEDFISEIQEYIESIRI
nr:LysR family transcriptional regulator substrate-binding protein [Jeotgalicoccus pinnipedialis]